MLGWSFTAEFVSVGERWTIECRARPGVVVRKGM